MIVKIQMSQFSSDNKQKVLIYDKSRDNVYETDDEDEVKAISSIMNGEPKKYFEAEIVDTKFQITEEVESQNW